MSNLTIGDAVIDFSLTATDGKEYTLDSFADKKAFAVIFSCNHCPYVLAWEDRIIDLQNEYEDKNVSFALICSNDAVKFPADSFERMTERAIKKNYPFPYLHDETQETAAAYGAGRTPEIFLFDSDRNLRYHGALDDNHEEPSEVKRHYLRDAIDALLAGREPDLPETPPVGCSIKWK